MKSYHLTMNHLNLVMNKFNIKYKEYKKYKIQKIQKITIIL